MSDDVAIPVSEEEAGEPLVEVKLLRRILKYRLTAGTVCKLPKSVADSLMAREMAIAYDEEQRAADEKAEEAERAKAKAESSAKKAKAQAEKSQKSKAKKDKSKADRSPKPEKKKTASEDTK